MDIKYRLMIIEKELQNISDEAYLLNTKTTEHIEASFHEKIVMPLKSIVSLAENIAMEIDLIGSSYRGK